MKVKIKNSSLELLHDDILKVNSDAIFCPDTTNIAMAVGLSSVLKKIIGEELHNRTRKSVPVDMGEIIYEKVENVMASYVIFAAVFQPNGEVERDNVEKALKKSLALCSRLSLKSIAIPMISSPRAKIPYDTFSRLMLKTIMDYELKYDTISINVSFVAFNEEAYSSAKTHLDLLRQEYFL